MTTPRKIRIIPRNDLFLIIFPNFVRENFWIMFHVEHFGASETFRGVLPVDSRQRCGAE